jgi:hypothetical protein
MKPRQKRILLNLIAIFLGFTFFGAGMSKLLLIISLSAG